MQTFIRPTVIFPPTGDGIPVLPSSTPAFHDAAHPHTTLLDTINAHTTHSYIAHFHTTHAPTAHLLPSRTASLHPELPLFRRFTHVVQLSFTCGVIRSYCFVGWCWCCRSTLTKCNVQSRPYCTQPCLHDRHLGWYVRGVCSPSVWPTVCLALAPNWKHQLGAREDVAHAPSKPTGPQFHENCSAQLERYQGLHDAVVLAEARLKEYVTCKATSHLGGAFVGSVARKLQNTALQQICPRRVQTKPFGFNLLQVPWRCGGPGFCLVPLFWWKLLLTLGGSFPLCGMGGFGSNYGSYPWHLCS